MAMLVASIITDLSSIFRSRTQWISPWFPWHGQVSVWLTYPYTRVRLLVERCPSINCLLECSEAMCMTSSGHTKHRIESSLHSLQKITVIVVWVTTLFWIEIWKVTKKFAKRKQAHVGMKSSKTNQTRRERHHNTFTPSLHLVPFCQNCVFVFVF